MSATTAIVIISLVAYLVGSTPFGLIVAKLVKGIDIRTAGSGNIGATNVARVVGARWGALVLVLDALKGLLPVLLLPRAFLSEGHPALGHATVVCGTATIVGHMFPCWLGFRGGKGMATSLGVILVLGPAATVAAALAFVLVFGLSRIVSLSSMTAAIAYAVCQFILMGRDAFSSANWTQAVFCLLVPLLILARHRTNIARLFKGTEPKFRSASGNHERANKIADS